MAQNQNQNYRRNNNPRGPMSEKLGNLRGSIQTRPRQSYRAPYPSADTWIEDGLDHINIYERSTVELGQALAHGNKLGFNHSIFGSFGNIEAFWHYIQSNERDDRIRQMKNETLKDFAKQLTRSKVTNFRAIIIDANYQRIKQYKEIVAEMIQSELPFDCYYYNQSDIRQRHQYSIWLIQGFEEIRKALKENREPDLSRFLDVENSEIYQFVVPAYLRNKLNKKKEEEKAAIEKNTEDDTARPVASLFAAKPANVEQQPAAEETTQPVQQPVEEQVKVETVEANPELEAFVNGSPTVGVVNANEVNTTGISFVEQVLARNGNIDNLPPYVLNSPEPQ